MRTQLGLIGTSIGIAAVLATFETGASAASADDARLTVRPAVQIVGGSPDAQAKVQFVQWRGPYGYRYGGYYGPFYGGPYYAPYYVPPATPYPTPYGTPYPTPYGTPLYRYPAYGVYGSPYPAYGYGYPAWGYPAYGGIGIRTGRVGIGIW